MAEAEIHIAPGPSAGACLQEGLGLAPEALLIDHDCLSCGPLQSLQSLEDWRRVRQDYLRSINHEDPTFAFEDQERDLLTKPEPLRTAGRITLWIGTGLAEQLLLVWVIEFLRRLDIDLGKLRIVQFNRVDKCETVGVGVLNPSQFKQHPHPTTLSDVSLREAAAAWTAVTVSEPDALLAFLSAHDRSLPLLQRSLFGLLTRYPDLTTGLNAWEHQLLQYVREVGPKATRVVGYTMAHDTDFPDWVGDDYLFDRLRRLADRALPRPLVALSGDTERLRGTEVRLTHAGNEVLAGKGNVVEWNGLDDWVGGVHLDSQGGRVWFRNDQTLVRG